MSRAGDAASRLVLEHQTAQNEHPTNREESEGIRMDTVASNPLGAACPRWCDPASSDHSREGIVFHGTSGTPATFIVGQYDDEDIVREHELHVSLANHEWNLETADEWRTTAAELRRIAADAARVASWLEANRNPMATGA